MPSSWKRGRALVAPLVIAAMWCGAACLPGTGPALLPDEARGGSVDLGGDAGFLRTDADLGDPFAIEGLTPSHGPFGGGTRARIDGRGFSSKLRVFIGGVEVDPASFLASDPTRATIATPPGPPGFVDVKIRDELTTKERVLSKGFYYDAFVVVPDSGATSGQTRIAITGSGTNWGTGTKVTIGGIACADVVVSSPTKLQCATPVGTPGAKDVVITPLDGPSIQARDAFTYSDSVDGYRGGLSGGAFSGRLKVLAYDSVIGHPIAGAFAIVGDAKTTPKIAETTSNGVIEIAGVSGEKVTVTVAARCFSPTTFVDVPVDTVTVYLDPKRELDGYIDPACASPPTLPGRTQFASTIEGQLVFSGGREFERAGWTTVPAPTRPTERRAAYAFTSSTSPGEPFILPAASDAITPETDGSTGYAYSLRVAPGNATIYVVGGIEDRSLTPPKFIPYVMGVAKGITVPLQTRVQGVDVKMDILFDHRVTVVAEPPRPGPRGPDRFTAQIATTLGAAGYAILPYSTRTTGLPPPEEIAFVGVPALDHAIAGESYVLGGFATTGYQETLPASVVSRVRTTNANTPIVLGGFLPAPILDEPGSGVWSGTHVAFGGAPGPVDLSVTTIANPLVTWTIVAPGGKTAFDLPDLTTLPIPAGLGPGLIETTVYVARIEQFDYGSLRNGHLRASSWAAYAYDRLLGTFAPSPP